VGRAEQVGTEPADLDEDRSRASSRRWRSLWRVHFYAGIFTAPFLVLMAVTGLIILYTQPIQQWTQSDLRTVAARGDWVTFDQQEAAVAAAFPERTIVSATVPRDSTTSTTFGLDDDRSVFVDPYTAEVLGTADPGGGIVGLANRLHGTLNNDAVTVKLPTIAGVIGSGPVMQDFVVGDMVLEVLAGWTLVLIGSGLYLWWPRRTRNNRSGRAERPLLRPRLTTSGRARWRDLHAQRTPTSGRCPADPRCRAARTAGPGEIPRVDQVVQEGARRGLCDRPLEVEREGAPPYSGRRAPGDAPSGSGRGTPVERARRQRQDCRGRRAAST